MTKIYLLRHAQSLGNVCFLNGTGLLPNTQYGSPLSELGKQQSKLLSSQLAEIPIDAIYSSHLQRAVDTIKDTAEEKSLKLNILEDLREIEEEFETDDQALDRFLTTLIAISKRHEGETVLVVAHGVLMKLIVHKLLPSEFPTYLDINIDNLAQAVLEYSDGFKILSYKGINISQH